MGRTTANGGLRTRSPRLGSARFWQEAANGAVGFSQCIRGRGAALRAVCDTFAKATQRRIFLDKSRPTNGAFL